MDIKNQIQYIGESILERFQYAESVRKMGRELTNSSLSEIIDLVESFLSLSKSTGESDLIDEALSYEYVVEKLIAENSCHKIFEGGFFNPFDDDESSEGMNDAAMDYDADLDDKEINIKKVRLWNSNTKNKIMYINGRMIAGQHFDRGDIIEKCPCRLLKGSDLYSNEIRKIAFPVDITKRIHAIPFGYGIYYRNSKEFGLEGNASYTFDTTDPKCPMIVIVATKRIKKGNEIILTSTDEDFENEIKDGQFDYNNRFDPYTSVKTIKIA